jgi:hypothetical protein
LRSGAPPSRNGPTLRQWIVLGVLFLLSLPAVTSRIYSSDEIQYFSYLRSLWFDHDLSFENEYRYFYDRGIARSEGFHQTFLEFETDTHRRINFATMGCAILWAPFYAVGDLVARAAGAPLDGFSTPYVAAVAYGSTVYGFLAVVLAIFSAGRLGYNGFTAALLVWLGTPLLFYMYVAPPFSHACSAFAVALFTYVWLSVRDRWSARGLAALGAAGALMTMTREQDAFFIAGPAIDLLWSLAQGTWRVRVARLTAAAGGCVAFCLVFAPQASAYRILNGHVGPHSSVANKMHWRGAHAIQVVFSPEHGFLVWTPLAGIAIAGLVWMLLSASKTIRTGAPVVDPRVPAGLLAMVALQIYIGGSVESWTVAGGFGQRRFVALTTALVIGYAGLQYALQSRTARRALTAVAILAVYWNLAMIAEFAIGLMDRQRLEPATNAYHAFVTLPRIAPSLAYRYLFDRTSFYQGPR